MSPERWYWCTWKIITTTDTLGGITVNRESDFVFRDNKQFREDFWDQNQDPGIKQYLSVCVKESWFLYNGTYQNYVRN